jgi:ribosomal protein S18 acetylase RimI-like enzyme
LIASQGVRVIRTNDIAFAEAKQLRYHVLFAPFGVSALTDFDDENPDSTHMAAFDRGRVVGYGRLVMRGGEAQIRHVCVSPSAQGHGVGTTVLNALVARARENGARTVFLNARFTALGVYRRLGFKEVGELIPAEDIALPHKRMELQL